MARKTSVLVYGAGGHGRVVLDAVISIPDLHAAGNATERTAHDGAV